MANEISLNATLSVAKGSVSENLGASGRFTLSGANFIKKTQSIPTTSGGTALDVAGLASLGLYLAKNNDSTNAVDLMSAVSGTVFATIQPGECVLARFPSGITAPAAIAHTAAVQLEFMILEN